MDIGKAIRDLRMRAGSHKTNWLKSVEFLVANSILLSREDVFLELRQWKNRHCVKHASFRYSNLRRNLLPSSVS